MKYFITPYLAIYFDGETATFLDFEINNPYGRRESIARLCGPTDKVHRTKFCLHTGRHQRAVSQIVRTWRAQPDRTPNEIKAADAFLANAPKPGPPPGAKNRALPPNQRRENVTISLNKDERRRLQKAAEQQNLSASEWVRRRLPKR